MKEVRLSSGFFFSCKRKKQQRSPRTTKPRKLHHQCCTLFLLCQSKKLGFGSKHPPLPALHQWLNKFKGHLVSKVEYLCCCDSFLLPICQPDVRYHVWFCSSACISTKFWASKLLQAKWKTSCQKQALISTASKSFELPPPHYFEDFWEILHLVRLDSVLSGLTTVLILHLIIAFARRSPDSCFQDGNVPKEERCRESLFDIRLQRTGGFPKRIGVSPPTKINWSSHRRRQLSCHLLVSTCKSASFSVVTRMVGSFSVRWHQTCISVVFFFRTNLTSTGRMWSVSSVTSFLSLKMLSTTSHSISVMRWAMYKIFPLYFFEVPKQTKRFFSHFAAITSNVLHDGSRASNNICSHLRS